MPYTESVVLLQNEVKSSTKRVAKLIKCKRTAILVSLALLATITTVTCTLHSVPKSDSSVAMVYSGLYPSLFCILALILFIGIVLLCRKISLQKRIDVNMDPRSQSVFRQESMRLLTILILFNLMTVCQVVFVYMLNQTSEDDKCFTYEHVVYILLSQLLCDYTPFLLVIMFHFILVRKQELRIKNQRLGMQVLQQSSHSQQSAVIRLKCTSASGMDSSSLAFKSKD